jgi:hypothetical protein
MGVLIIFGFLAAFLVFDGLDLIFSEDSQPNLDAPAKPAGGLLV